MIEIFADVRDEVKKTGETAWRIAMSQKTPIKAADFLSTVTDYYKRFYTEEEIEFLQFYFNTQMEMMKDE